MAMDKETAAALKRLENRVRRQEFDEKKRKSIKEEIAPEGEEEEMPAIKEVAEQTIKRLKAQNFEFDKSDLEEIPVAEESEEENKFGELVEEEGETEEITEAADADEKESKTLQKALLEQRQKDYESYNRELGRQQLIYENKLKRIQYEKDTKLAGKMPEPISIVDWDKNKMFSMGLVTFGGIAGFLVFALLSMVSQALVGNGMIAMLFGGMFAFIFMVICAWTLSHRQVRRALMDALNMNKSLAEMEFFLKNRRKKIFDAKIPIGTSSTTFGGMKDDNGIPMVFEMSQNPHINESNRVSYTFHEKSRQNIDDFISSQIAVIDPDESMIRDKDMYMMLKKVRMEQTGGDKVNKAALMMILVGVIALIISIMVNVFMIMPKLA